MSPHHRGSAAPPLPTKYLSEPLAPRRTSVSRRASSGSPYGSREPVCPSLSSSLFPLAMAVPFSTRFTFSACLPLSCLSPYLPPKNITPTDNERFIHWVPQRRATPLSFPSHARCAVVWKARNGRRHVVKVLTRVVQIHTSAPPSSYP